MNRSAERRRNHLAIRADTCSYSGKHDVVQVIDIQCCTCFGVERKKLDPQIQSTRADKCVRYPCCRLRRDT